MMVYHNNDITFFVTLLNIPVSFSYLLQWITPVNNWLYRACLDSTPEKR
jgi:hypothetical protein